MKLLPEQYWEWRTSIAEMHFAEEQLKFHQLQYELMLKDQEIARLRSALFRGTLSSFEDKKRMAKEGYESTKKKLEEVLGIKLNGCVIDDVTFEVKVLEDEKVS